MAHINDRFLKYQNSNSDYQDIISFLAKPIVLTTGSFSTTDTYSFLQNYHLPYTAFTAAQGVLWTNKLAGIYGIRMDMRIRLVVNANRFQQGRYIIGWMPLCGMTRPTGTLKDTIVNNTHMATLVQRTTVHHSELDLNTDTTAELLIPYTSARNFYNMNTFFQGINTYSLGFLNIYPYIPMSAVSGSTTCGYTVYISFENVTLFGSASPQSGKFKRRPANDKIEVAHKGDGPISSVTTSIAKGFSEFSDIPLIGQYCAAVSWIADRITGCATIFGWSKPTAGDNTSKIQLLNAPNHTTVDGDSDARTLSFMSKPGVEHLEGVSGTVIDEMDFATVVRRPAWFATATWSTTDISGTNLQAISVNPLVYNTVGGARHYTPVGFVTQFFNAWRGSLRYRFKIIKTEFHSGRLSLAFFPGTYLGTLSGNAAYVHRQIIDIRETNTFEVVVPYISDSVWLPVLQNTGSLMLTVLDPLVAPATVSGSISIAMEICGGTDLEFAMPGSFDFTPGVFVPQSGNVDELYSATIGSSVVSSDPISASAHTVGDKVSNFRAYLKRFHPIYAFNNSSTSTTNWNNATQLFHPDAIIGYSTSATTDYYRADPLSAIASCYGLWRGGVRYRLAVNKNLFTSAATNVNQPSMALISTQPIINTTSGFGVANPFPTNNGWLSSATSHTVMQEMRNNPVITIEMPMYSNTVARATAEAIFFQGASLATGALINGAETSLTKIQFTVGMPQAATSSLSKQGGYSLYNVYRAMADDGDLSVFISVPALYLTNSVSTTTNNNFF